MQYNFEGVVLKSSVYGENDRIVTVLTRSMGKITMIAKGARKLGCKYMSSCLQFAYADFCAGKTGDLYFLKEAELKNGFFGIAPHIEGFALASYIAQVAEDVSVQEESEELLSLILNCFHLIAENKKTVEHIKAVFELRCAVICGLMPNLVGCRKCGKHTADTMYLEVMNGTLLCSDCKAQSLAYKTVDALLGQDQTATLNGVAMIICPLSPSVLEAARYIVYSEPKKVFSFSLSENVSSELYDMCEKYLLNQLERSFSSLAFYKDVIKDI